VDGPDTARDFVYVRGMARASRYGGTYPTKTVEGGCQTDPLRLLRRHDVRVPSAIFAVRDARP